MRWRVLAAIILRRLIGPLALGLFAFPSCGAPIAPGSILVTVDNSLQELAPDGALLQSFAIPYPGGDRPVSEVARDVQLAQDGSVLVFNGTFSPNLSRLDPVTGAWTYGNTADWNIGNDGARGAVASIGDVAFVGNDWGAIRTFRFQLPSLSQDGQISPGVPGVIWYDLAIAPDGYLYALEGGGNQVFVYDPFTLALQRTIDLNAILGSNDVRAMAIGRAGDMYFADFSNDRLYRVSAGGQVLNTANYCDVLPGILSGCDPLDIAVSADGRVAVGYRFGHLVMTNETFGNPNLIQVGEMTKGVFVDLAPIPVPAAAWLLGPALGVLGWARLRSQPA